VANNVIIKSENGKKIHGRLVGLIDEEECRAIMNSNGAAKKISTAETLTYPDVVSDGFGKRAVVITNELDEGDKSLFISPIIKYVSYCGRSKTFHCRGKDGFEISFI